MDIDIDLSEFCEDKNKIKQKENVVFTEFDRHGRTDGICIQLIQEFPNAGTNTCMGHGFRGNGGGIFRIISSTSTYVVSNGHVTMVINNQHRSNDRLRA